VAGTATAEGGTADTEGDTTEVGTTDTVTTTPDITDTTVVGVGSPVDTIRGGCFSRRSFQYRFLILTTADTDMVQDTGMDMDMDMDTD
jgi:hypothetical protein